MMKKYLDVRAGVIHGTCQTPDDMPPPPGLVPVADDVDLAEIEGRAYDVATGVLGPPLPKARVIGLRDFFRLFTAEEVADIAALRAAGDVQVIQFDELARLEPTVDLAHADVARGLALLQTKDSPTRVGNKVVTASRAAEIAAGTPPGR